MSETKKSNNGLFMLLSIPLILQTAYFAILLIQQTESTAFRLFIGFVGIGLTIMPLLMNWAVDDEQPQKIFFKIRLSPQATLLVDIIGIIIITVSPWIAIWQHHAFDNNYMTWEITPGSVMALSSSILAFCLAGISVFTKNMNKDEKGITIVQLIIIAACMAAVMKIYLPTLFIFIFKISVLFGSPAEGIFRLAVSGPFWQMIVMSISEIVTWQLLFLVSLYFQHRFYKRFLGN